MIEYDGAEVGMVTTRGYRDILHMARHKRPHNFSMQFDLPWQSKPLVKRRNRIPVTERILPPDGRIEVPLDEDEVRAAAELLKAREVDAVIICFIFSFLNAAHEKRAKEIVAEVMPDTYVSCSSEVVDMIREYERFSTAAMNAFIGPRTAGYLRSLRSSLRAVMPQVGHFQRAQGLGKPEQQRIVEHPGHQHRPRSAKRPPQAYQHQRGIDIGRVIGQYQCPFQPVDPVKSFDTNAVAQRNEKLGEQPDQMSHA